MSWIINKALRQVPAELHDQARTSLAQAKARAKGLTLFKLRARWLKGKALADRLAWRDERLLDVAPELAAYDIEPMVNVTAHGDNAPWDPATGRPAPGQWLDTDQASEQYRAAVAANYWLKGTHPRSGKSRRAWYRRNAGAYTAWERGAPMVGDLHIWGSKLQVIRKGEAWQIKGKVFGVLKVSLGYEIANVYECKKADSIGVQKWYPIDGHELRAPVSWSILPGV